MERDSWKNVESSEALRQLKPVDAFQASGLLVFTVNPTIQNCQDESSGAV